MVKDAVGELFMLSSSTLGPPPVSSAFLTVAGCPRATRHGGSWSSSLRLGGEAGAEPSVEALFHVQKHVALGGAVRGGEGGSPRTRRHDGVFFVGVATCPFGALVSAVRTFAYN
ncbi:unnamed protein product [Miscanthus lutarioriparius]|uniref:Uncharacterized protein n=1 Tax=Miscanthus lutarioriparius TaxID=422564 RepID=A0A811RIG8_9POAL|nr:unnamed protein product [Miscanthus lutarioriparius]